MDYDGTGRVTEREYLQFWEEYLKEHYDEDFESYERQIELAFEVYNIDQDEFVDATELEYILFEMCGTRFHECVQAEELK